jgi:hypothetical protein
MLQRVSDLNEFLFVERLRKRMEIRWEGVDWINLAQDRDQWRGLMNIVMSLPVP